MTIDAAIATLTAEFPLADDELDPASTHQLTSGGEIPRPADVDPALWASADKAIAAWLRETQEFLRAKKPASIFLLEGPHLDKWFITVMDERKTHRVAEDRWSVTASIGLVNAVKATEAA